MAFPLPRSCFEGPVLKILVTGANGHLGLRLIVQLAGQHDVVAAVRSESALAKVGGLKCSAHVVDYKDSSALTVVADGCHCVVHLVGIIKSSENNSYEQAHELPCEALVAAAQKAGINHIVALSIIGSGAQSTNDCFASRGRAEEILLAGDVPVTILRVPMVLGENDFASRALHKKASSNVAFTFRHLSLEQPIYAGDVVDAIQAVLEQFKPSNPGEHSGILELAGPESVTRRELIARAGQIFGNSPAIVSLPVFMGVYLGRLCELFLSSPPITGDMIDLLDHDDDIDSLEIASILGINLTSLDNTLRKVLVD